MDSLLLLPGQQGFNEILATNPPPNLKGNNETNNRTAVMGIDGLLRGVNSQAELDEYILGGEYEIVMTEEEEGIDLDLLFPSFI